MSLSRKNRVGARCSLLDDNRRLIFLMKVYRVRDWFIHNLGNELHNEKSISRVKHNIDTFCE